MIKRNYYLPEKLVDCFVKWSKPGRNYSPSVAGAILAWMALDATVREEIAILSQQPDIEKAVVKAQAIMADSFVELRRRQILKPLTAEQVVYLVEIAKETTKHLAAQKKVL